MKNHSKALWAGRLVVATTIAVPIGLILYFLTMVHIVNPYRAREAQNRITSAEPTALLNACRYMITNREDYRDKSTRPLATDDSAIILTNGSYAADVPQMVKGMNPLHISVDTDRVLVLVHVPPRTGFIGYLNGADELEMLHRNRAIMLTNGLWMFSN